MRRGQGHKPRCSRDLCQVRDPRRAALRGLPHGSDRAPRRPAGGSFGPTRGGTAWTTVGAGGPTRQRKAPDTDEGARYRVGHLRAPGRPEAARAPAEAARAPADAAVGAGSAVRAGPGARAGAGSDPLVDPACGGPLRASAALDRLGGSALRARPSARGVGAAARPSARRRATVWDRGRRSTRSRALSRARMRGPERVTERGSRRRASPCPGRPPPPPIRPGSGRGGGPP